MPRASPAAALGLLLALAVPASAAARGLSQADPSTPAFEHDVSVCYDATLSHAPVAGTGLDAREFYGFCFTYERKLLGPLTLGLQPNFEEDDVTGVLARAGASPGLRVSGGKLAKYGLFLQLTAEIERIHVGRLTLIPYVGAGPGFAIAQVRGVPGLDGAAIGLAGDLYAGVRVPFDHVSSVFVELWSIATGRLSVRGTDIGTLSGLTLQIGWQVNLP